MDLKHRCRILRSRGRRGALCGKERARLKQVQDITDRGPGTCSRRRRGDEPTEDKPPRPPKAQRLRRRPGRNTRGRHTTLDMAYLFLQFHTNGTGFLQEHSIAPKVVLKVIENEILVTGIEILVCKLRCIQRSYAVCTHNVPVCTAYN